MLTKTELKHKAQDHLMSSLSIGVGYWDEQIGNQIPADQHDEFRAIIKAQAERAAKLFGYDEVMPS